MLSVPPEVTDPTISSSVFPALSMLAVMETISASNFRLLGKVSKWIGLLCEFRL
jgi:hypothetical protein